MRGLLADVNIEGHFTLIIVRLERGIYRELWHSLKLSVESFENLGLTRNVIDSVLWETCQREQLVLVTGNRNADGPDSLEEAIRSTNSPRSLPVFTLANPARIPRSRDYADLVAESLMEHLMDIDHFRGAGRVYLP